MQVHVEVNEP